MKPVASAKIRALVGTNPVVPLNKEKLSEITKDNMASPDKSSRVVGYMGSSGMRESLTYQNNEGSFEPMSTKPQNRGYVPSDSLKKEQWKPKTSLKWHEPYKAPLTLQ